MRYIGLILVSLLVTACLERNADLTLAPAFGVTSCPPGQERKGTCVVYDSLSLYVEDFAVSPDGVADFVVGQTYEICALGWRKGILSIPTAVTWTATYHFQLSSSTRTNCTRATALYEAFTFAQPMQRYYQALDDMRREAKRRRA